MEKILFYKSEGTGDFSQGSRVQENGHARSADWRNFRESQAESCVSLHRISPPVRLNSETSSAQNTNMDGLSGFNMIFPRVLTLIVQDLSR